MGISSLSLIPFLLLAVIPLAYADHDDHDYYKIITIESDDVDSDLTDFPLLLNFTDSDLQANAFSDGLRITFVNSTLDELSHEIEQYDSSNGWLTAWVKIPSISSSTDTDIRMYYGNNTNLSDQQSITDTWRSEYKLVTHLHDDFLDSTINNNDGSNTGSADSTGLIADSQNFDGINDLIDYGSDSTVDNIFTDGGTITAWINPDGLGEGSGGMITDKRAAFNDGGFIRLVDQSGSDLVLQKQQSWDGAGNGQWDSTAREIQINVWNYVVVTYDGSSTSNDPILYVDGVSVGITESGTPVGTIDPDAGNNLIVGNRVQTDLTFDGDIEEFRVYDEILSADWIDFEYCNQVATAICEPLTVGSEVNAGIQTHTIDISEVQWIIDTDEVTLIEFFETHTINVSEVQWIIDSDNVDLNEGIETHTINVSEIQWIIDSSSVVNDNAGSFTPSGKFIWFNVSPPTDSRLGGVYSLDCGAGNYVQGILTNGTLICTSLP